MARDRVGRPQGPSEVRLRLGGVEIQVTGATREDCWRQLEHAVQDLERAVTELRYRPTAAGEAYLQGYRDARGEQPTEAAG